VAKRTDRGRARGADEEEEEEEDEEDEEDDDDDKEEEISAIDPSSNCTDRMCIDMVCLSVSRVSAVCAPVRPKDRG
jgi:hypothetical protein